MRSCEQYKAQMLEHLYGLLEADESLALIEHAGQCDDCRTALLSADTQKKLLSAAAKTEFAGVRFEAPAPAVAGRTTDTRKSAGPRPAWRRWAVAAGILLAVLAIGIPVIARIHGFHAQEQALEVARLKVEKLRKEEIALGKERDDSLARADKAYKAADKMREDLEQQQRQKLEEVSKAVLSQQFQMTIRGPGTVRVGQPSQYQIETRDKDKKPVPVKIDAVVRDQTTKKVVFEQKGITSNGTTMLALAPEVAVKGGTNLALELVASTETGGRSEMKETLTLAQSTYITHLVTDKPMYQPGETVFFRSLTLDRFSMKPATDELLLTFILTGPQGNQIQVWHHTPRLLNEKTGQEVLGPDKKPVRGIGTGLYTISPEMPGGEYTLEVKDMFNRFSPEKRKFVVNRYQKQRLNKELKFDKPSYGPGADVVANLKVEKVDGGIPVAGKPVVVTIRVDGETYTTDGQPNPNAKFTTKTDALGTVAIRFKLPAQIKKGDASLNVEVSDGANFEAYPRPIPVVVNKLQMEFFPEGGDLITGVPNRVYFNARTMLDKAAAVNKAQLLDENDNVVLDNVSTLNDAKEPGINQGNGSFVFTPEADRKYRLQVTEPAIPLPFDLPAAKAEGVVLMIGKGVSDEPEPIEAIVRSVGRDRELLVGAYCRGRLVNFQEVNAKANQPMAVSLKPAGGTSGIYRVTVFEKRTLADERQQLQPVAERLVYRFTKERLNIAVQPNKTSRQYVPGEKVELTVRANTETGESAPTIMLVAVVDKSVIKMADERTFRTMPTHFLLTSEIRRAEDLEYVDVLLSQHPQARQALDLMLGTQGWRRFLESDPKRFENKPNKTPEEMRCQADVDRLLMAMNQKSTIDTRKAFNTIELQHQRVIEGLKGKFEEIEGKLVQAEENLVAARQGRDILAKRDELRSATVQARNEYSSALAALDDFAESNRILRSRAMLVFGLVLILAGGGSLLIGATRNLRRAIPFYGTAVAAVAACGLILIGTFYFDSKLPEDAQVAMAAKSHAPEAAPVAPGGKWNAGVEAGDDRAGAPPQDEARKDLKRQVEERAFGRAQGGFPANKADKPGDLMEMEKAKEMDGKGGGAGFNRGEGKFAPGGMIPQAKAPQAHPAADGAPAPGRGPANQPMNNLAGQQFRQAGMALPMAGAVPAPAPPGFAGKGEAMKKADEQRRGAFADEKAAAAMPFEQQQQNGAMVRRNLQAEALGRLEAQNRAKQADKNVDRDRALLANVDALQKLRQDMVKREAIQAPPSVLVEYAHVRETGPDPDIRSDFSETLCWQPVLVMPDGTAHVSFQLCDSVTQFQVIALGHTLDGRLGSFTTEFDSRKPFNLNANLPLEVTSNDTIDLPVVVENTTNDRKTVALSIQVNGLAIIPGTATNQERLLEVMPKVPQRSVFRLKPTMKEGNAIVTIKGTAEPFGTDTIRYTLKIVPEGFPIEDKASDVLEKVAHHEVELPKEMIKGTLKVQLALYPSTLADLQKGLEGLLREPSGCFEQTSTSNYPNVMILGYLKENNLTKEKPQVEQRARDLLTRGYAKLVGFECQKPGEPKREGYEWFGGNAPAHEALTAYGLLQFRDMKRVGYPVDDQMVERTRTYLLSRKDGKGGFLRNARALDTFGRAPENITNAYIVWALTESEEQAGPKDDLEKEIDALVKQAQDSKDPYFLGLVANVLLNRGKNDIAAEIVKKIGTMQKPEGWIAGATTSITGSGGQALQIETTALAVLAWVKLNQPQVYHKEVSAAIKWIGTQRGGYGGFGSTQSTILALKALLAFAKGKKSEIEPGEVTLTINGKKFNRAFTANDLKDTLTVEVPKAEEVLKTGNNEVQIDVTGKSILPYTLSWNYQSLKPPSADKCPIRLAVNLEKEKAQDGEVVSMKVSVENTAKTGQGMVVAIVGLPAGLELPANLEQLKTYARLQNNGTEPGRISAFEVRGRELVLYWRQMAPEQKIEIPIELNCRVPGDYRGPAGRAYLYYTAENKFWIDPIAVAVTPKP